MNDFDWESQLLEENKTLRQIISDTANEDSAHALKYKELRDKIDKAIEDINTEMSYGSARFMQETMYHKGLKRALEILKRNIGE